jgi:hypothetical protein
MTAHQLIDTIQAVGGRLEVDGECIRCRVPENHRDLLEEVRRLKPEVMTVLATRPAADMDLGREVMSWLQPNCVAYRAASCNPKFLYREFCAAKSKANMGYETFIAVLAAAGFYVAEDGMIEGLCLALDWDAATRECK